MTRNNIIRIAKQTAENGTYEIHMIHHLVAGTWLKFICDFGEQVAAESAAAEREAVLQTIDALYGSEENPMFVEGYDAALDHIKQFIEGRKK